MRSIYFKHFLASIIIVTLLTSLFPLKAYALATASISSSPSPLTENNLNGSKIEVEISGDQLVNLLQPSHFNLQNAPSGTVIASVYRSSDTTASLSIAYNGLEMKNNLTMIVVVKKEALVASTIDVASNGLLITYVEGYTPRMYGTPSPNPLLESNLNGATITFTNPYHDFKSGRLEDFYLMNAPPGLSIASYTRVSNRIGEITLAFDGTDFDIDYPEFYVRIQGGETITGGADAHMVSNYIPITAIIEPEISAYATSNPKQLIENSLDGSIINLTLYEDSFVTYLNASDFELANAPEGLTVDYVIRDGSTSARIFLAFDGTNFDDDIFDFRVLIHDSGLARAPSAISEPMTIQAIFEIEGLANYIATGNAYPSQIEMTGYNVRLKQLHINTRLTTELDVTGKTATFSYFTKVYNSSGEEIGSYGDFGSPHSVVTVADSQSVDIINITINLSTDFPSAYRIVVTVTDVTLN